MRSTKYIIGFAAVVCLVCSVVVSGAAVLLKERQTINKQLDQKKKVLGVVSLYEAGEDITPEEINQRFSSNIVPRLVDLKTGKYVQVTAEELASFDQRKARQDPARSAAADANSAKVLRVPNHALVYLLMKGDAVEKLVLPVEGKGLWSTLYGYIALESDTTTIAGLTFYEHGETPGLGGEVDNPSWQALWPGRKAFDGSWKATIDVKKGAAGSVSDDPHNVDGLSGATITSRGVGALLRFWLEEQRFGAYLANFRNQSLTGGQG
ncbi:MAG: Na(+)-translocating NADH-quinone reductase subunit C [Rickettsiales bacterium]|nr:Na(+)-translocating NADH-quinone reductase subunit C [Rickettsiales bacterium]